MSKVKGLETFSMYKGVDKGVWGLENSTTFIDVICVSSLEWNIQKQKAEKDLGEKKRKFHLFPIFFTGESVLPC